LHNLSNYGVLARFPWLSTHRNECEAKVFNSIINAHGIFFIFRLAWVLFLSFFCIFFLGGWLDLAPILGLQFCHLLFPNAHFWRNLFAKLRVGVIALMIIGGMIIEAVVTHRLPVLWGCRLQQQQRSLNATPPTHLAINNFPSKSQFRQSHSVGESLSRFPDFPLSRFSAFLLFFSDGVNKRGR